jgi:hypothetical protein
VSPDLILEIDHIIPVSKGGNNDFVNLVTACFDCNRGKSKNLLSLKSIKHINIKKEISLLKEHKAQIQMYFRLQKDKEEGRRKSAIFAIEPIINSLAYPEKDIPKTWMKSVTYFITQLGIQVVRDRATSVSQSFLEGYVKNPFLYFCACCHRMIKERDLGG